MNTKQKQALLFYLGYYTLLIDGEWGNGSTEACREFQTAEGLTPDGVPGPLTQAAMIDAVKCGRFKAQQAQPTQIPEQATPEHNFWANVKYFTREEFRCTCGKCGGFPVEPTKALVFGCDALREAASEPLYIVEKGGSGVRCRAHNATVKGESNSNHLFGRAADLHPTRMTPKALYDLANKQLGNRGELGLYSWGIHFAPEGKYSRYRG